MITCINLYCYHWSIHVCPVTTPTSCTCHLLPHRPVAVCHVTTDLYLSLLPHCDLYTSLLLPVRPVPASTVTILTCTYKAGWLPDKINMINTRIFRKHLADIPVCLSFTTVQLTLITVMSSYHLRHDTNSKRQNSCLYSQGFKWSCQSTEPLGFRGCNDLYMSLLFPHWFEPVYCYHTNMYMSILLPHLPVHVTTVTTLLYLSCPVTTLASTCLSCYPTLWPVPVCPVTTLWRTCRCCYHSVSCKGAYQSDFSISCLDSVSIQNVQYSIYMYHLILSARKKKICMF